MRTHPESAQAKLPPGFTVHSYFDGARGRTWFVENTQTQSHVVSYQPSPAKAVALALKFIKEHPKSKT